MGDTLFAIVAATVLVVGSIAQHIAAWLSRRARGAEEPYAYLCDAHGFTRKSDRYLNQTRVIRYAGEFRGVATAIEVGDGPGVDYARVEFTLRQSLQLGIRISSDREDGALWMRLMRMREVRVGLQHFDAQFILLARREDRLKQLLDHEARRMLMDLGRLARDVRQDDVELHVFYEGRAPRETLDAILEEGAQLATHLVRRAEDVLAEEVRQSEEQSAPAFTPLPGTLKSIPAREEQDT